MQLNLMYFFIAIGLSMDAFSLALAYGTLENNIKKEILLSITVGIFHFFMPLIGAIIGQQFLLQYINKANYLVGIIFILLSIEMFLSKNDNKSIKITNFLSIIMFAFTVSIDSFSVGIALSLTNDNITPICLLFSIISAFFTIVGVLLGKTIAQKIENKSEYLGATILLLLGIKYIFF